jgi:hypothetical protein
MLYLFAEVFSCFLEHFFKGVDGVLGDHVDFLHVFEHYMGLIVEALDTVIILS